MSINGTAQLHLLQQVLKTKEHEIHMLVKEHASMQEKTTRVQLLLTMLVKQWGGEIVIEKDSQTLGPNLEVALQNGGEGQIILKLIEHEITEEQNGKDPSTGTEETH